MMNWSDGNIDLHGFAVKFCDNAFPVSYIKADQCTYVLDTFIFYLIKGWSHPNDYSDDNWIIELMADIADELVEVRVV